MCVNQGRRKQILDGQATVNRKNLIMRIIEGFETFYLLNPKNMGRQMPTQFCPIPPPCGQVYEG